MPSQVIEKYAITPVPKPRMTHRDKWRPAAKRYFKFKRDINLLGVRLPKRGGHVIFNIPMPKSWLETKKIRLNGRPHEQIPDWDNLGKALSDAVYGQDCVISDIRITKRWAYEGSILIINQEKGEG